MSRTGATARIDTPRAQPLEMRSARQVQACLRPHRLPRLDSLDYAGCCLPGREVGGDFYDFLEPRAGRLVLVLGDISGNGIPAALMMAALQASLRSHYALSHGRLERRVASVNRMFHECTAAQHYASLFLGEYDDATGRLRYVNCGHVPPLLVHRDLSFERLESTAQPLGLFERWSGKAGEARLAHGDTLVMATDGVVEATGPLGEEFGEARLLRAVRRRRDLPPASLIQLIARNVRAFSASRSDDDQTLVVARANRLRGANHGAW